MRFNLYRYVKTLRPPWDGGSDGVLNPSGIRFGSGEIYTVMEQFSDKVNDSLCVGQRRPQDKDERVLLFLKMRPGHKLDPELMLSVKAAIRKGLSPRHVPAFVLEVSDIPVSTILHYASYRNDPPLCKVYCK